MRTLGKTKLHFGTGYTTPLPQGWTLQESPEDWAIGIAPDGQEYFLGTDAAYPRRVTVEHRGSLKPGDTYIDMETGVISLANVNVDSGLKALDVPRLVRAADSSH
jgi:hypothetical protein